MDTPGRSYCISSDIRGCERNKNTNKINDEIKRVYGYIGFNHTVLSNSRMYLKRIQK